MCSLKGENLSERRLNTAVIGAGYMGTNHARIYVDLDSTRLVAVADPNKAKLAKLGAKYNINTYIDYMEMLKKEDIDLVSIAAPTSLHYAIGKAVIDKGIDVLIEKPITKNVADAKKLIAFAKKKKVKLFIGHVERFNAAIVELQKQLAANKLGKIYSIIANRQGPFSDRIDDVGVAIDLAVHDLDIINSILHSNATKVLSFTKSGICTKHEDLVRAILLYSNGVVVNLNVDWITPTKIRELIVTGEKGAFKVEYLSQNLEFYENKSKSIDIKSYSDMVKGVTAGNMVRYNIEKTEPLKKEILSVVDCIHNNKRPLVSGEDALKAIKLAHMLKNSM